MFLLGVTDLGSTGHVCALSSLLFVAGMRLTAFTVVILEHPPRVRNIAVPRAPWCMYHTPGYVCAQTHSVGEEHEEHEKLMAAVQAGMETLLGSSTEEGRDDAIRATVLANLKANLSQFGKDVLEHLDHEEYSFATPIARKVTNSVLLSWARVVGVKLICCES